MKEGFKIILFFLYFLVCFIPPLQAPQVEINISGQQKVPCEFILEEFDQFLNSVKNRLENEMVDARDYFSDMESDGEIETEQNIPKIIEKSQFTEKELKGLQEIRELLKFVLTSRNGERFDSLFRKFDNYIAWNGKRLNLLNKLLQNIPTSNSVSNAYSSISSENSSSSTSIEEESPIIQQNHQVNMATPTIHGKSFDELYALRSQVPGLLKRLKFEFLIGQKQESFDQVNKELFVNQQKLRELKNTPIKQIAIKIQLKEFLPIKLREEKSKLKKPVREFNTVMKLKSELRKKADKYPQEFDALIKNCAAENWPKIFTSSVALSEDACIPIPTEIVTLITRTKYKNCNAIHGKLRSSIGKICAKIDKKMKKALKESEIKQFIQDYERKENFYVLSKLIRELHVRLLATISKIIHAKQGKKNDGKISLFAALKDLIEKESKTLREIKTKMLKIFLKISPAEENDAMNEINEQLKMPKNWAIIVEKMANQIADNELKTLASSAVMPMASIMLAYERINNFLGFDETFERQEEERVRNFQATFHVTPMKFPETEENSGDGLCQALIQIYYELYEKSTINEKIKQKIRENYRYGVRKIRVKVKELRRKTLGKQ